MTEQRATYTTKQTKRVFSPHDLSDYMAGNQQAQFLQALAAVHDIGGGAVTIIVTPGRAGRPPHVRWILAGKLEDFALPEEYR